MDVPTDSQIDRQHFTQSIIICNCKDEWFSHGSLGASIGYLYVFFEHNNRLLGCAVTFLSGNLPFVARPVRFAIPYARLGHDSDAAVAAASAHFAVASQQFACLLHNCQVGKKSNNISTTTSMNWKQPIYFACAPANFFCQTPRNTRSVVGSIDRSVGLVYMHARCRNIPPACMKNANWHSLHERPFLISPFASVKPPSASDTIPHLLESVASATFSFILDKNCAARILLRFSQLHTTTHVSIAPKSMIIIPKILGAWHCGVAANEIIIPINYYEICVEIFIGVVTNRNGKCITRMHHANVPSMVPAAFAVRLFLSIVFLVGCWRTNLRFDFYRYHVIIIRY